MNTHQAGSPLQEARVAVLPEAQARKLALEDMDTMLALGVVVVVLRAVPAEWCWWLHGTRMAGRSTHDKSILQEDWDFAFRQSCLAAFTRE